MKGKIKCPKCGTFCPIICQTKVIRKGIRYLRRRAYCEKCGIRFYKDQVMRKGKYKFTP